MSLTNHLVLFVRQPRLGQVKTRLARDIGTVAAWSFYRRTMDALTRRLSRDERWRCWLAVTPDSAVYAPGQWPGRCWLISQGPGNLGTRMGGVASVLGPGPVVIAGADVPGIRRRHIARAFQVLGAYDAVFGPAADGGYWLVGLRRRPRFLDIFEGVRWSTEYALADTLRNLGDGQTHALIDTLDDVDDGEAYEKWRKKWAAPA